LRHTMPSQHSPQVMVPLALLKALQEIQQTQLALCSEQKALSSWNWTRVLTHSLHIRLKIMKLDQGPGTLPTHETQQTIAHGYQVSQPGGWRGLLTDRAWSLEAAQHVHLTIFAHRSCVQTTWTPHPKTPNPVSQPSAFYACCMAHKVLHDVMQSALSLHLPQHVLLLTRPKPSADNLCQPRLL
jgi:hypothetical protein